MTDPHIAVVGSGSLARSVCYSLAALASPAPATPIRVTVLARGSAASDIAGVCQIRAAVTGGGVTFAAESLHDEVDAMARLQPDVLVCCASAQSPYERTTAPSAWTSLIARAGFGATLPLQATLIVRLARAVAQASPRTLVVNGCFPDVVNPLLTALKAPVTCGIGNVSTLAACLQAAIGLPDQDHLAVLGHHVHLSAPGHPDDEALAWYEGQPLPDVTGLLRAARAMDRRELNGIAGHAAARLLLALVTGAEVRTSLPGPLGLPGGYPVTVADGSVTLRLPPGVTRADAVAWNLRVGRDDGVEVVDGRVSHSPRAIDALAPYLPELAAGWPVAALDEVTERLTELRQRLRLAPAASVVAPGTGAT
ncbi:hypothetical protein [Micromonospora eburnea]|uniref:Uncharacterized protein n=1 Tax=Micromonospora eburnea TaxID=227316 RepID=A0A1C6UYJ9_9ACTN|nr:hypothetical protein [Micromonospora eburnea]SCL58880.1 hypothetical protein GA0070604_3929 [Micromonospora eburnea]